jgi:hypothetical protein
MHRDPPDPALAARTLKARLTFLGSIGEPYRLVNTRP